MRFRHPLIVIVFVVVLLVATLVGFITANEFAHEARHTRRASVSHLLDAVSSWSVALNRTLADDLSALIAKQWTAKKPTSDFLASEFQALALVDQDADGSMQIGWWSSRVSTVTRDWAQSVLPQLSGLPFKNGEVFWQRVLLPNQQVLFAIAMPIQVPGAAGNGTKIAVGFAGPGLFELAPFADVSGKSELFIVNQDGVAVGYPEARYVGSKIDDHPIVAAMMASPSAEKIQTYSVGYQKAVGGYEHVQGSNLYVVATKVLPGWLDVFAPALLPTIEVSTIAVVLLCLITAMALGLERRERSVLKENLRLAKAKVPATNPQDEMKPIEPAPADVSASEDSDLLRGVVDFMRGHTTAMVGLMQMMESHLNSSTANPKVIATHKQLNEVVRNVRDFSESLGREIRSTQLKLDAIDLPGLLNAVIAVKKPALTKHNIQIEDNFQPDLRVVADFARLKASLTALLGFVGEYLSGGDNDRDRRILLHAQRLGGMAQLRIEGRGREIPVDIRRKIFTPFQFKTKNKGGIDLALARARINEMNGDVTVEPIGFEGFEIICKIPAAVSETPNELREKAVSSDLAQILPALPEENDG